MQRKHIELIWLRGIGGLKADAQNSYLGSIWWVLEPICLAGLMFLAFSNGIRGSGNNQLIFLLLGLFPLKWTTSCLSGGSSSIIANTGLIGQVYLPKWIFPFAVNLSMLLRFSFVLPTLLIILWLMLSEGQMVIDWLSLLNLICCQMLLNLGISLTFAAFTPLIPDIKHLIPIISMGLMFTSGVFFDIKTRPEDIQAILYLNPLTTILDAYRAIILDGKCLNFQQLAYPWFFGLISLAIGITTIKVFDRYYPRALT